MNGSGHRDDDADITEKAKGTEITMIMIIIVI